MELAWKDQNVVLFMTTVVTGKESELVRRRRPATTATNTRTSRAVLAMRLLKTSGSHSLLTPTITL